MSVWGITSGNAGMVAQVRALAWALNKDIEIKNVNINKYLSWIPNVVYDKIKPYIFPYFIDKESDPLTPPWPEMVISCGRRAAIVAMGLRQIIPEGTTKFIHIQDPLADPDNFDIVIAMEHDDITGPNVIKTRYALHTITNERLKEAATHFARVFSSYPRPYISVLLGGSTNKYTLVKETMAQVIVALTQLLQNTEGSLLITPSKRTGDENIAMLKASFAGNPRVYIYDFVSENPYMGLLGLADTIVVSNDSVNMMSEARATGKPIYILPLPGHHFTKPAHFASLMITGGVARPLGSILESWTYPVADDMKMLVGEIRSKL